ncbi:MAG: Crp/Fnr family transcriptional regulator [Sphingobacteriaceae bacterium]|nr:Crp/Fnr family transcriptional regulator [Sphingobacteriaceae bacterium]
MEFNIEKYHLKSSSLFDFLTPNEAQLVRDKMIRREYEKGEYLFRENSYSKGVYLVRKGKVKIFQTNSEGKQSIVYIYKKGDYFGYRPLLAEEPHPVSAVAMDNLVISFIPRDLFSGLLSKSSHLARKLLGVLSKEFSVWINKMTIFSQYAVKERVALSLLILNKIYQRSDENIKAVSISINRDDFAGFVGTAKETLVRMLRTFKDDEIIVTKGTKIKILKYRTLYNIVSGR